MVYGIFGSQAAKKEKRVNTKRAKSTAHGKGGMKVGRYNMKKPMKRVKERGTGSTGMKRV
jgi:hypothetical protein